ncbi:LTA synthase family protein [Desulfoluna spongiiphila]|uniref:LTA synthase family protein n=1 Tax=Desulfoluna spongiiphila TaxID=419481 RepID=UPI00125B8DB1|nr:LTA synthase family protein [Desulfoluna spongiiphila]VVS93074.1 alkaline phosphatase-like alpha/beta/alpha [Desulfoluna spongiiphila]
MVWLRLFTVSFIGLTGLGTLLRLFFYLCHREGFPGLSFGEVGYALVWGLRFDVALAAIFALLSLLLGALLFFGIKKRPWALAPLALSATAVVALQTSDIMYFHDANRHIGYELSDAATDVSSLVTTAFTQYAPVALGGLLFLGLALWGIGKSRGWVLKETPARLGVVKGALVTLAVAAILVISVRGGVTGLPMSPLFAYKIGDPVLADLALNGGYSGTYYLFRNRGKVPRIPLPAPVSPDDQRRILSRLYPDAPSQEALTFLPVNVVVLLLESWPASLMHSYGYKHETTPFFDSLADRGLRADAMIAGGHRTTEGIFTTFCSYQNPLGQTLAKSQLTTYPYQSLAQSLADSGWHTLFFQGTRKDTSGTGAFAQRLGFQQSFGKEEIHKRTLGTNEWGVYDQDLYAFALKTLKATKQPFLAGINTCTTHDDSLPPSVTPAFGMGTPLNRKLSVLRFADEALEGFITAYEADPDFGPTLFVLLADHTAGITGPALTQYLIPFTLFATDESVPPQALNDLVSQRDIAPTVAHLLQGEVPAFTGRSLLKKGPRAADYYHQGLLGWVEGDHVVEINILGSGEANTYLRGGPLDPLTAVAADAVHARMVKEALAFTQRSQNLLFEGRTLDFFDIFKAPSNVKGTN